jgi:archaea-specific DNA-binding protein
MTENHTIFVGGKPFMNYVTAVVMQFTTKGANTVVVRSRGKFISRAVDVAEVVKSRFLRDQIEVNDIKMDSEEFKNREGRTVRVSTLDISLVRITKPLLEPVAEPVAEQPTEQPVAEPVAEHTATPEIVPEVAEEVQETTEPTVAQETESKTQSETPVSEKIPDEELVEEEAESEQEEAESAEE